MIVSPPLIMMAPVIAERTHHLLPIRRSPRGEYLKDSQLLEDHVLIAGYGVNGGNLARVLKETGIPYVIFETDPDSVMRASQDEHPVVFGDVTRREILAKGGIGKARLLVYAISDPPATRVSVRLARSMNPGLFIIVRTRLVAEVDELLHLGANEVIPEEFETSIEIFTRVLNQYHIPRNVVNAQINVIRDENYRMLRGLPQTEKGLDRVAQLLAAGTSDTFLITGKSHSIGKSLKELDLRRRTGVTVIAVVRGAEPTISPPPDFRIDGGDILVLVGTHASMDKAFDYLEQHPEN
jgi:CPA2 family monovalent cation:H+ antiporter-2